MTTNLTTESIAAMSDRKKEIACAVECGLTVERTNSDFILLSRGYIRLSRCVRDSLEAAWEFLCLHYLTDAAANDTLLDEADRRDWVWMEDRTGRIGIQGRVYRCCINPGHGTTTVAVTHPTDRRRVRVEAFLAACAAEKGGAG